MQQTSASPRARAAALTTAALGVLTAALLTTPATAAAPGTFGALRYVDGTLCHDGAVTTPLAAWDFGTGRPAYLLTPVRDGGDATAPVPEVVAGTRALRPGEFGFATPSDLATVAALLGTAGSGHAALVAQAVYDRAAPGTGGCVDAAAVRDLVDAAAAVAGPYTVTLDAGARPAVLGDADPITATVTAPDDSPVAGVTVTFAAASGTLSAGTAVTDVEGRATVRLTVPMGTPAAAVTVTASTAVVTGLQVTTLRDPHGAAPDLQAVSAADPTTFRGTLTLPIDRTASPTATTAMPAAVVAGTRLTPTITVGGMRGHLGTARVAIAGPLPFDRTGLCSAIGSADWTHAPAVADVTPALRGDGVISGPSAGPLGPGCWAVLTHIETADAVPAVTVDVPPVVVAVLDTQAGIEADTAVVAPGAAVAATATVTRSHGLPGRFGVRVDGPATPGDGDCGRVDWSRVLHTDVTTTATGGDGGVRVPVPALRAPGCYRLSGTVSLAVGDTSTVTVPVTGSAGSLLYVLSPTVSVAADRTWAAGPEAVPARVTVSGTYGQSATVRLRMAYTDAPPTGCRGADFRHAVVDALGPAAHVSGDGDVTVASAAPRHLGCYTLVPVLTLDANPAVQATGRAGAADTVVLAAQDAEVDMAPVAEIRPQPEDRVQPIAVGAGFGAVLVLVVVGTVGYAAARRDDPYPG